MKRMPTQKLGRDTPSSEKSMTARSVNVFCLTAAITPEGMAMAMAMAMARKARAMVWGSRSRMDREMERPLMTDNPRSPCRALPSQVAY